MNLQTSCGRRPASRGDSLAKCAAWFTASLLLASATEAAPLCDKSEIRLVN